MKKTEKSAMRKTCEQERNSNGKNVITVFENSDKILTFVLLRAAVNFETFADAFLLLENSYKFLPILFML